jgi:uncharacterized protein VirK/YbjX
LPRNAYFAFRLSRRPFRHGHLSRHTKQKALTGNFQILYNLLDVLALISFHARECKLLASAVAGNDIDCNLLF